VEVVASEGSISRGSMNEAKAKGKLRLDGKEYQLRTVTSCTSDPVYKKVAMHL